MIHIRFLQRKFWHYGCKGQHQGAEMNSLKEEKKIIWAMDPIGSNKASLKNAITYLKEYAHSNKVIIKPVYVVNTEDIYWHARQYRKVNPNHRLLAELQMKQLLKGVQIPGLQKPVVLNVDSSSLRGIAKTLIGFAKKEQAEAIVLNSQSKGGLERTLLGSFAETLTMMSDLPLVVLHPQVKPQKGPILFPTDFSKKSKQALDILLANFSADDREFIILHHFTHPLPLMVGPFNALPVPAEEVEKEIRRLTKQGEKWVKFLLNQGRSARFVLVRDEVFTQKAVLMAAKRLKPSLLTVTSKRGLFGTFFLGSVARYSLRHMLCPIWILHGSG